MKKILSLALLALGTSTAFAGGYRVAMQGTKQLAMGHTGVAVVNSAEVLFFNPAGISFLEDRFNASVGATALFSHTKFQNKNYNVQAESKNMGTPFYAYFTYRLTDWMTAGLAVYSPYGSTVEWDKDWEGSHLVNDISLQAIYVQPVLSFKLNEYFSVAGGPIFVTGAVDFNRNISRSITDENGNRSNVTLKDSGVKATGWTAGFMFNPSDKVRLGMSYRSEMIMESRDGEAVFSDMPAFLGGNKTTGFSADLPLPAEFTVGLSYKITDNWLVAFDYNRTKWGVYENLDVKFGPGAPSAESLNPRNYKDSSNYRVGVQNKTTDRLTLRAGWYYDESPVQDGYFAPETPRNDSQGFTAGFTYKVTQRLGVDVSFLYLKFSETNNSYDYYIEDGNPNITFGGDYKNSALAAGLGLSYSF